MAVTITHTTPADGTFSATGAAAWDANHAVSGLGTMAEQDANNVNITGGSITGVTGVLTGLTVNSTPTSGGAAGQIMFDTGSVLQESSNLVWDNTNKKLTITGATVTTSQPVLDMTQTWDAAGVTFTGLKFNVTNTASATASTLIELQVNGASAFWVDRVANINLANLSGASIGVVAGGRPRLYFNGNNAIVASNNLGSAGNLGFASAFNNALDVIMTRRGAANLRFGAADAAAPVAQTLSVQSVVAGTSNTAGANLTITGSQGTGTGAGGSIIFQVAPAGSSGTAQNALSTALTIGPTNIVTVAANLVVGSPSSDISANLWGIVNSSSSTSGRIIASEFKGADSSTSGGVFLVAQNSSSAVTSGARLGIFSFAGKNAANSLPSAAQLRAFATENWGSPNYGSRFELATTANGSINTTTRLIIGNSGIITFGATEANTVPALKPSSTILQVRLADDSAYAPVEASTVRTATAYTVATLPVAGTAGRRAYVTDATAPTWLGALIGGGTVVCPVFDNGTAWVAG